MKNNNSTLWIIVAGIVVVTLAYWFACVNRGLCAATSKKAMKQVEVVKEEMIATTTSLSAWEKVSKEPFVIYMDVATGEPVLGYMGEDVRAIAAYAKDKNANIYITGHSSYVNTWQSAQDASVKNANALKEMLVSYGANADRIYVSGKAYSNPVYGKSRDDIANNRAVISVK